jgi:hypothetical protein
MTELKKSRSDCLFSERLHLIYGNEVLPKLVVSSAILSGVRRQPNEVEGSHACCHSIAGLRKISTTATVPQLAKKGRCLRVG